jgi:hypothetical protein
LSATYEGKKHDKRIADESDIQLKEGCVIYQDCGFQGFHLENVKTMQPKKKKKHQELSEQEKAENAAISSIRVIVEHVISGVKRCRILKDVLRNTREKYDDLVMELSCSLHNFRTYSRIASY